MNKKFKGLVAIQDVLDDRYQKLYDKYKNLQLSHNRKKKALQKLSYMFCEFSANCSSVAFDTDGHAWNEIRRIISDALFSDGRIQERHVNG